MLEKLLNHTCKNIATEKNKNKRNVHMGNSSIKRNKSIENR